jgi:hypothetical protein
LEWEDHHQAWEGHHQVWEDHHQVWADHPRACKWEALWAEECLPWEVLWAEVCPLVVLRLLDEDSNAMAQPRRSKSVRSICETMYKYVPQSFVLPFLDLRSAFYNLSLLTLRQRNLADAFAEGKRPNFGP